MDAVLDTTSRPFTRRFASATARIPWRERFERGTSGQPRLPSTMSCRAIPCLPRKWNSVRRFMSTRPRLRIAVGLPCETHGKLEKLARPKRFELLTPRFVVWCSIQLSYGRFARRPGNVPACGAGLSYRFRASLASAGSQFRTGEALPRPAYDREDPAARNRGADEKCGDQRNVSGLRLRPAGCRRRRRRSARGFFHPLTSVR